MDGGDGRRGGKHTAGNGASLEWYGQIDRLPAADERAREKEMGTRTRPLHVQGPAKPWVQIYVTQFCKVPQVR